MQISEGPHRIQRTFLGCIGHPLFKRCCELDATKAVEMKVFVQAKIIAARGVLSRNLRDESVEPVARLPDDGIVLWGTILRRLTGSPLGNWLPADLTCRGTREIRFRPDHPAANALEICKECVCSINRFCRLLL